MNHYYQQPQVNVTYVQTGAIEHEPQNQQTRNSNIQRCTIEELAIKDTRQKFHHAYSSGRGLSAISMDVAQ